MVARRPVVLLSLLVSLLGGLASAANAAAAGGESPPAPEAPVFGERIDVRAVDVAVVVTDRAGKRATGLGPADFQLTVDGRPVPIDYFSEVRGGAAVAPPAGEGVAAAPAPPGVVAGQTVPTSYLLFVDEVFSIAPRRDVVLARLKDDLARLGPEDRMAIVAYDGRLTRLADWTGSRQELAAALDAALRRPAHGLLRLGELKAYEATHILSVGMAPRRGRDADEAAGHTGLRGLGGAPPPEANPSGDGGDPELDPDELSYASQLTSQIRRSVRAVVAALHAFGAPPGRRVLLLFGGWPHSTARFTVNDAKRVLLDRELPDGAELQRPLDDAANLLGYAVYPVEAHVLGGSGLAVRDIEMRSTLATIAEATGGEPILSGHHESLLATLADDAGAYYRLGFTPAWKADGARHELAVQMNRPGLVARARQSYVDLSARQRAALQVERAMLFGPASGSPRLPVQLGAAKDAGRGLIDLPLTVAVPVSAVTFVPAGGKHVAELDLRVAAVDTGGNPSDVPAVPIRLTLARQPEAGKYVRYETTVRLRRADQRLTIALVDRVSDAILLATAEVHPR